MDALSSVALAAGLGWASGMRLYAVLFFLGLLHRAGAAVLPPDLALLAHPAVMTVAGTLFLAEFLADKVPGFDTLWDIVHTFVRIPAGALLAAYAVAADAPSAAVAAGLLGGAVAAGTHLAKSGARALINASPEPFTNWGASLTEDVSAIAIVWLAIKYPLLLLGALVLFVCAALWLAPKIARGIRRVLGAARRPASQAGFPPHRRGDAE